MCWCGIAAVDSLGPEKSTMLSHPTFAMDACVSHLITEFAASARDHTCRTPESTTLFNNGARKEA